MHVRMRVSMSTCMRVRVGVPVGHLMLVRRSSVIVREHGTVRTAKV